LLRRANKRAPSAALLVRRAVLDRQDYGVVILMISRMNQLYRTGSGFSGVGKSVVRYKGNIRKMEIRALPHLGNQLVEAIKGDALAQYFQWRVDHAKKTPAISTLRDREYSLNQIFRFAKRKGYISDPPVIAIPSSRQNSRPDISETEWRTLYTYLRNRRPVCARPGRARA
jgi:hypothetical protein